jgi:tRNA pseudouridine38-40 synthase
MRRAAEAFVGRQDFAAFSDDDPDEKSTVVVLERLELVEAGALVLVRVQGSHFLWKMVRRIVGVLAAVGRGEMKPADAAQLLSVRGGGRSGAPTPAELTAPAAGLFLEKVRYKGDPQPGPVRPAIAIE